MGFCKPITHTRRNPIPAGLTGMGTGTAGDTRGLPVLFTIYHRRGAFLLTLYVENDVHGPNYTRPSADLAEHEEPEWEVDRIVGH
jgi:hypothetical protein